MTFPSIVYYGPPGLDADVFSAFMANLGYAVRLVAAGDELAQVDNDGSAILVIAADKTPEELVVIMLGWRYRAAGVVAPIFVRHTAKRFNPNIDCVFVLPSPFPLSAIVKQIQAFSRHPFPEQQPA